ncbi:MAG: DsrE/DsrF/TusD sulfur relay family protein [Betaproteobacteria bacterium]
MQNILIIAHSAPYGSERCLSALRLATALAGQSDRPVALRVFLMSDAVVTGLPNQASAEAGGGLQQMLEGLVAAGVTIKLCRTCALARGIAELPLIAGVNIGTLPELATWVLEAEKVISL